MLLVWLVALVAGVGCAAIGSRRAVDAALDVVDGLGVGPGLVGVSVMAIGTDLPEIANSIMAALSGHGDLNVGDSTGSALTQVTLILALLILAAGLDNGLRRDESDVAAPAGLAAVVALVVLAVMLSDGTLGRLDGALLVAAWIGCVTWMERRDRKAAGAPRIPDGEIGGDVARTLLWLAVVGVAATVIVKSFTEATDAIGVPEFVASSIVLALGTSLPELVVDWTAVRRGVTALAIGDLFGSSLVDATLSVGIGPMLRATAVSSSTVTGTLVIATGVAVATMLVAMMRNRRSLAFALLLVYGGGTATLISLAG